MPGLGHLVTRALRGDRLAGELARKTNGEVADIDHFLHFAQALGDDLARLKRDQRAERFLGSAQFFTQQADKFAAAWRRRLAPGHEGFLRLCDDRRHLGGVCFRHARHFGAVNGRVDSQRSAIEVTCGQAGGSENLFVRHLVFLCLPLANSFRGIYG